MKTESSYVFIKEARFYAYHGATPQEQVVGQEFLVSIRCSVDLTAAMEHDILEVTLDYGALYRLIEREMKTWSHLVEHVAGRIAHAVFETFPQVTSIDMTITKVNPPIGGDCQGTGVEVHLINDKTKR